MNPRHVACKLCRERKVRCPGQQPACDKCRRAGEECIYLPAQKPFKSASDLHETVEALQKRLNEAETLILNMGGHLRNTVAVPSSRGFVAWPASPDFSTLAPPSLSEPSIVSRGSATQDHQEVLYHQPHPQLPEPESSQVTASRGGAAGNVFQGNEPMDFDESLMLDFNQESFEQAQVVTRHSFHESPSQPTDIPPLAPSRDAPRSATGSMAEDTGVATVLDPLAAYCSSVIRREAEMAGLATAVADYIAWMRNMPSTGAPPVTNPVYQQMLQNIEIRVRELVEIAHKKHDGPLRGLLGALGGASGGDMAARVAVLEDDLQKQMRDQASFFKTEYDACKFLSEQAQKRP
ncbi:hypothetical protein CONLIGDRAFT_629910 [Coniochaeta ligniaria NRRL 30616]|uniref:Zn(2)-C6 fungal-type domain-containing protein n=1 Tax=Coniochaeta ligniaria NRRL 30616 TaxID=1408157 RepID=A0A1J7IYH4_9PEZI|nr:hypothetical protein CONLIGDRAFT_629910 [Coniochaeta ligniaria NRRL 30616]